LFKLGAKMITVVLGFATALVYGFADFFGAISSRKLKPIFVTLFSGLSGLVFLMAMSPIFGLSSDPQAIFWGILAGLGSAIAVTTLYASLAIGPISIISPLGAVMSALVPMFFGILFKGEQFSLFGWFALMGILIAVVLVGFVPSKDARLPSVKGLVLGVTAGSFIGLILIFINQSPPNSGLTPVVMMRLVSASTIALFVLISFLISKNVRAGEFSIGKKFWLIVALTGILDSSANVFFLFAMRFGSLTVVSVLTALYPLGTIILARIFLKEKIAKVQLAGVLLALSCSALLASGI
jgi:drug/metabolite transporter (DMT)-like permease